MFDVTAIGELLIDFTPNGTNDQGTALYAIACETKPPYSCEECRKTRWPMPYRLTERKNNIGFG